MKHYAGWPVKLKGVDGEFHITAAYFGESLKPGQFRDLQEQLPFDMRFAKPQSARFTRWGNTFVIEVMDVPEEATAVHEILSKVRPSDYPTYRPHVTVPKALAMQLCERYGQNNAAPVIGYIGPLTLFEKENGGEWRAVWSDNV